MIMDGDFDDYDTVYILGAPATALFWKQWIDAESDPTRITHLTQLNQVLTVNSDTDWNVPPFVYQPLHELIDDIAGNAYCYLDASMNVLPYMVHEMVDVADVVAGAFNVSQSVIDLVGTWCNEVVQMTPVSIPPLCLNSSLSIAMTTTSMPTAAPTVSIESTMMTSTATLTSIDTTNSDKQQDHDATHHSHLFAIGISVGIGGTVLCLILMGVLLSRMCGYALCQKPGQIDSAYTVMDNERM